MKYNYEILSVDSTNKVMEVRFTATNETSVNVSMPFPSKDEDIRIVLHNYSPVNYWNEKKRSVDTPNQGTTGVIWSDHPTETEDEYNARIAGE
tara:strand:+ start:1063 stop:1341 length:279 start_codon:yes stop_codon:yes gene_type:complete